MNLFQIIATGLLIYLTFKINQIIMTQKEAIQHLTDLQAGLGKVKTEVQKLITAAEDSDTVSQEMADAITSVKAAFKEVDDLNQDAPVEDTV